ncbi:MAG: isoprenylcysteine carboxylmethyltransferase family protein [bacterium]|nr:isoprenylcysteine carboxylmethyltransferase family protein [bacterium]
MNAENPERGAAVRIPPPLVYLAGVIVGILLHAFVLPLPLQLGSTARISGAALLGLCGLLWLGAAANLFKRTGQDPKPWKPTPEVISGGIYRYTRNPMYVGMALLQSAIAVGTANVWILILLPVVLVVVYATAIRHEEAYLECKFGASYTEYRKNVRRWI